MYDTSPKYISRPLDLDFVLLAQDKSLGLSQKMGALGGLGILDLVQLVTWYLADGVGELGCEWERADWAGDGGV